MTRDEIMALEAGPETDALVAKAVHRVMIGEWSPSISHGDAMEARAALPEEKRGGYLLALYRVVHRAVQPVSDGQCLPLDWSVLTASPLDRCKAILLAMMDDGVMSGQ